MLVSVFCDRLGLHLSAICVDSSDVLFCQDLQRLRWDHRDSAGSTGSEVEEA